MAYKNKSYSGREGVPSAKKMSMGSSKGSMKMKDNGGSSKGTYSGSGDNTREEPVSHESSFRGGKGGDKNMSPKVMSGTPRQEASYQNRDRQGSGIQNEPTYQRKLKSYPTSGPKTKKGNREDAS